MLKEKLCNDVPVRVITKIKSANTEMKESCQTETTIHIRSKVWQKELLYTESEKKEKMR